MNDVGYQRPEFQAAYPAWERVRAACAGEAAVKAIPGALPRINDFDKSKENEARNASYLRRAVWYNATGRTLDGLIGLAFRKDPIIDVGNMKYLLDDADGNGLSIYNIAQKGVEGVLQTARHGYLVDIVNNKPRIVSYAAESIINWRTEMKDGKRRLVLLVLEETKEESAADSYAVEFVKQWRVYRLVNDVVTCHTVSEKTKDSDGMPVEQEVLIRRSDGNKPELSSIPFFWVGAKTNDSDIDEAPLVGLADLNYAHYRNCTDYEDSVFYCGQAQPWISGLDAEWRDWLVEKKIYVGSRTPISLPVNGQFGIAQAQPNTLAHEAMKDKEQQMVSLGARLVEMGKITKTATQAAGDLASSNSVLTLVCSNTSEALIRAIQTCGEFERGTPYAEANFRITQDYTEVTIDAGMLTALVKAWQSGGYPKTAMWDYFRKVGLMDQEMTDDEAQTLIDNDTTTPMDDATLETTLAEKDAKLKLAVARIAAKTAADNAERINNAPKPPPAPAPAA